MSTNVKTTTRVRSTKAYKDLLAAGLSDKKALKALGRTDVTPLAKGTKTKARVAVELPLGKKGGKKAKATKAEPEAKPSKEERLVAKAGKAFTRGRTYSNPAIIEAQVRVHKTGKPEVVPTSGVGRISAVLITRTESGDVAVQNLQDGK